MHKCLNFDILEILRLKRNDKFKTVTKNKECFVLACRLSGESSFFYNNTTISVKRGDILYIPVGLSYSQICEEKEDLICFHLDIFGTAPKEMLTFTPNNPDEMCELFKSACKVWAKKDKNFAYLCMSILYSIVSECDFITQANKNDSIIKKALIILMQTLTTPIFPLILPAVYLM